MPSTTTDLVLPPNAFVDLQTHTTHSDGRWAAEDLLDHAKREQFGLLAITDHDRPEIAVTLQELALTKQMPLLIAVEMTAQWNGQFTDVLCYGFDPGHPALQVVAEDLVRRQTENTRQAYEYLVHKAYIPQDQEHALSSLLSLPSARQPHALVDLVKQHRHGSAEPPIGELVRQAGCDLLATEINVIVEAAHRSGAVCILAHPGRDDGFICYDELLLDTLRAEVPIDGIEVYYPKHSEAQTIMFRQYAQKHKLLMSAGSDSHGPEKPPIKYSAELIPELLERVGVRLA
jgi:predicted metal-dependent phosphoesterase TrpH